MVIRKLLELSREALAQAMDAMRSTLFLLLAAICIAACGIHIWSITVFGGVPGGPADPYRIDIDNSFSEKFEYVMLLGAVIALTLSAFYQRAPVLLFPAFISAYMMLDNAFEIHEAMGKMIYPHHARAGEVIFAGFVGSVVAAIAWQLWKHATYYDRRALITIGIAVLLFSFFAVVIDAIHSVVARYSPKYDLVLGGIEDFGEMISIALLLAIWVRLLRQAALPASTTSQTI